MTIPTQPVTCHFTDESGAPMAARVSFKLTVQEVYANPDLVNSTLVVSPDFHFVTTDAATGTAVVNLFPNALGANASQYNVMAVDTTTGRRVLSTLCTVPDAPCNLHDILNQAPFPAITAAQAAVIAAQAAQAAAAASAATATTQAGNAETSATSAERQASWPAYNVVPGTTEYSAKHYAYVAEQEAANSADSASTATTKAGEALASANAAAASAALADSAGNATIAATQAEIAIAQADIATTQAGLATTAKTAAEAARDVAQLSAGVYATTTAGLAATTSGQYFSVPSSAANEYLILYLNSSSVAVEQKRYPSAAIIEQIIDGTAVSHATLLEQDANGVQFDFTQTIDGLRVAVKQNGVVTFYDPDAILSNSSNTPNVIINSSGSEEYSPHNLFLNSAAPATQTHTAGIVGETYTVSIIGSGSVEMRTSLGDGNALYGTATQAAPLTFVASTVNVRIATITGSVTRIQLNRGPVVLKHLATTAAVRFGVPISKNPANGETMFISEPNRTNYLLQSKTPATQTTASLATGTYCLWVTGSGSATTSAGSATITGAGTSTEGVPNVIVVTVAGTVTVTVSGSLTHFQLENSTVPTSKINTFAATRGRSITQLAVSLSAFPALGSEYLVYCDYWLKTLSGLSYQFSLFTDSSNQFYLYQNSGPTTVRNTVAGVNTQSAMGATPAANARAQFTCLVRSTKYSVSFDGKPVYYGDTKTVNKPPVTTLNLGSQQSQGPSVDGFYIRRFALVPTVSLKPSEISSYFYEYPEDATEYDILMIAGQSNTGSGFTLDPLIDTSGKRTYQLSMTNVAAFGTITGNVFGDIYEGKEPMRHPFVNASTLYNAIGYGVSFARDYYVANVTKPWTKVLLINCGVGNTGYGTTTADMRWNPGDDLYIAMCSAVGTMLAKYPNSKFRGLLWMLGEYDGVAGMSQADFAARVDAMITDLRAQFGPQIPVIVGGMKPAYVAASATLPAIQAALIDTPNRVALTGYANPSTAPAIGGSNPTDPHYTAAEQRIFAGRFWAAWQGL